MAENITIREPVHNQSSVHPLQEKLQIVNKGRPTPPLPNVITHHKLRQNDLQDIFASLSMERLTG